MSPEKAIALLDAAVDKAEQLGRGLTDLIWIIFKIPSPYSTLTVLATGLAGEIGFEYLGGDRTGTMVSLALSPFLFTIVAPAIRQREVAEGPQDPIEASTQRWYRRMFFVGILFEVGEAASDALSTGFHFEFAESLSGMTAFIALVVIFSPSDNDRGEPLADKLARLRRNLRPRPAIATNTARTQT